MEIIDTFSARAEKTQLDMDLFKETERFLLNNNVHFWLHPFIPVPVSLTFFFFFFKFHKSIENVKLRDAFFSASSFPVEFRVYVNGRNGYVHHEDVARNACEYGR